MDPDAKKLIPPEQWGADHWSTLAYAFSTLARGGVLDRQKLRLSDGGVNRAVLQHTRSYPTRLAGGETRDGHDDLDCLEDMAAAGLLHNVGTGMAPAVLFTDRGLRMAQWLCVALGAGDVKRSTLTWEEAQRKLALWELTLELAPVERVTDANLAALARLSPNVRAVLRDWDHRKAMEAVPPWALERAAEIAEATVPQVDPTDSRNMLYEMPAGLKLRLMTEIAAALVEAQANAHPESSGGEGVGPRRITTYAELLRSEDLIQAILRAFAAAQWDSCRCLIEIWSDADALTLQEHRFWVDPLPANAANVILDIVGRLTESPDEDFEGLIRLVFLHPDERVHTAGGGKRYGSFAFKKHRPVAAAPEAL